ncbi:MAG: tetratricopeptide repeat protein [Candidatus Thorarchaeota archaeon]
MSVKERELRTQTESYPEDPEAWFGLGVYLHEEGRLKEAEEVLQRVVDLAPMSKNAHMRLGSVHEDRGDLQWAWSRYLSASEIDPDDPMVWSSLATTYLQFGKSHYPDADLASRRALALKPKDAFYLLLRGTVLHEIGHPDRAQMFLKKALKKAKRLPEAWLNLAIAEQKAGDTRQAIKILEKGLRFCGENVLLLATLGAFHFSEWQLRDAIEALERAIAADPDSAQAHYYLGSVLGGRQDHEGAERSIRRAIKLEPDDPDYHSVLADLLVDQERLTEAREVLERLCEIDHRYDDAYLRMRDIETRTGPSRNPDLSVYVRDSRTALVNIVRFAGKFQTWARREVAGVQDILMNVVRDGDWTRDGHYRFHSLEMYVFADPLDATKKTLEEWAEKHNKDPVGRVYTYVTLSEGRELPQYIIVLLRPFYEVEAEQALKEGKDDD